MTQYELILKALRKAGNKGCTVRDLLQFTNYPSARLFEMTTASGDVADSAEWAGDGFECIERIERHWKEHNGRKVRLYVLKRVK